MLINRAEAWNFIMGLVERPSALDSEFFAPRFYFTCTYVEAPWLTAIAFLGQDRSHAIRQFERRRDNHIAEVESEA